MMTYFQTLFSENNSNVVEYEGVVYHRYFPIVVTTSVNLKFKFVNSNSTFTQAIVLFFPENFNGKVSLGEKELPVGKRFPMVNFWEDTAPAEFGVSITNFYGEIGVCNGSDPLGTKAICKHLSGGCAMIVEKQNNLRYRFHCHDHTFSGGCNNLIFELEINIIGDSSLS